MPWDPLGSQGVQHIRIWLVIVGAAAWRSGSSCDPPAEGRDRAATRWHPSVASELCSRGFPPVP